jgi:pentatricopeptide repeat protein
MALHVLGYLRRGRAPVLAYLKAAQTAVAAKDQAALGQVGQDLRADGLNPTPELALLLGQAATRPRKGKGKDSSLGTFMAAIRECSRTRDAARALELLRSLRAGGTRPDTIACNAVLDVCVKAGEVQSACELLEEMKKAGMVDAASFNSMLNARPKAGHAATTVAEVDYHLSEMARCGVVPTIITFNAAMNIAVTHGDSQAAWRYFSDLGQRGLRADAFTCSILLKGLKDFKTPEEVDRALKLLESRRDIKVDDVLVGALLDATVKLKDAKRIGPALAAVRDAGILPTPHAYATVLRALAQPTAGPKEQRWEEAKKVWAGMWTRRVTATEGTYHAYVDCAVACDDFEAAAAVLAEMKQKGPAPTAGVYATVVRGLVLGKEMDRARALYSEMKTLGLPVNLVTYNALVDAMAKVGDVEGAADLFRDMCSQGIAPDLVTYSTIIKGYCVQGDLEQAIQLFTLMRKRGLKPDQILFNSLLDGCSKKPMRNLAEQVTRDMEECGVEVSNYTLSILVKLYGRCGDVDAAKRVIETMSKKYGFEVNVAVQTCLVQALLSAARVEEGLEVFSQIKKPDAKAYNTAVRGCLKQRRIVEAVHFADLGLRANLRLDHQLVQDVSVVAQRRHVTLPSSFNSQR